MTSQFAFFDSTIPTSTEKVGHWLRHTQRENFTIVRALVDCYCLKRQKSLLSKSVGYSHRIHALINLRKEVLLRPKLNVSSYIHFLQNFRNQMKFFSQKSLESVQKCGDPSQSKKIQSMKPKESSTKSGTMKKWWITHEREGRKEGGMHRDLRSPHPHSCSSPGQLSHEEEENPNWTVVEVAKAAGKMWSM